MSCIFYGKSHLVLLEAGCLYDQNGNECALIFDSFAPCRMETDGERPDQDACPIARAFAEENTDLEVNGNVE